MPKLLKRTHSVAFPTLCYNIPRNSAIIRPECLSSVSFFQDFTTDESKNSGNGKKHSSFEKIYYSSKHFYAHHESTCLEPALSLALSVGMSNEKQTMTCLTPEKSVTRRKKKTDNFWIKNITTKTMTKMVVGCIYLCAILPPGSLRRLIRCGTNSSKGTYLSCEKDFGACSKAECIRHLFVFDKGV